MIFKFLLLFYILFSSGYSDWFLDHVDGESPFVGYREWKSAKPSIRVYDLEIFRPVAFNIELNCLGADEFIISPYRDFRGESWKKMTDSLRWEVNPNNQYATIWVRYKRKNTEGYYEITEPINYVIDRYNLTRKIKLVDNGYWDMSEGYIYYKSLLPSFDNNKKRYGYYLNYMNIESSIIKDAYLYIQSVFFSHNSRIDNLFANWTKKRFLEDSKDLLIVDRMSYNEDKSMNVYVRMQLVNDKEEYNVYKTLKEYYEYSPLEIEDQGMKVVYDFLVLDLRGYSFVPSIYLELLSYSKKVLLNPELYTNFKTPYIKYYRNTHYKVIDEYFSKISENGKKRGLFIRAYGVGGVDHNSPIISDEDIKYLHANLESVKNISRGNFYIITD